MNVRREGGKNDGWEGISVGEMWNGAFGIKTGGSEMHSRGYQVSADRLPDIARLSGNDLIRK